jgi:hypothetical protein
MRRELRQGYVFTYPSQDDYDQAKEKARRLLRQVLPDERWEEFESCGTIHLKAKDWVYVISNSPTEICHPITNKRVAISCLQLSIPAPVCDRMVAEYLLIRNAEDVYWKTANVFPIGFEFNIPTLFLIAFDIALFVNLLLELLNPASG